MILYDKKLVAMSKPKTVSDLVLFQATGPWGLPAALWGTRFLAVEPKSLFLWEKGDRYSGG